MSAPLPQGAYQLAAATTRARSRGLQVGTRAQAGKVQVVRVIYDRDGGSVVTPLSDWLPVAAAITWLDNA